MISREVEAERARRCYRRSSAEQSSRLRSTRPRGEKSSANTLVEHSPEQINLRLRRDLSDWKCWRHKKRSTRPSPLRAAGNCGMSWCECCGPGERHANSVDCSKPDRAHGSLTGLPRSKTVQCPGAERGRPYRLPRQRACNWKRGRTKPSISYLHHHRRERCTRSLEYIAYSFSRLSLYLLFMGHLDHNCLDW